jgi:hypothetical protein
LRYAAISFHESSRSSGMLPAGGVPGTGSSVGFFGIVHIVARLPDW